MLKVTMPKLFELDLRLEIPLSRYTGQQFQLGHDRMHNRCQNISRFVYIVRIVTAHVVDEGTCRLSMDHGLSIRLILEKFGHCLGPSTKSSPIGPVGIRRDASLLEKFESLIHFLWTQKIPKIDHISRKVGIVRMVLEHIDPLLSPLSHLGALPPLHFYVVHPIMLTHRSGLGRLIPNVMAAIVNILALIGTEGGGHHDPTLPSGSVHTHKVHSLKE
mmetsp:Transcript_26836/g.77387  ORF Transcript_26836/g.77387 Transcript_26836/m.77387 type:complete len:217 (-) Transcript_26836:218-868(-)